MQRTTARFFWIVLVVLLCACTSQTGQPTNSAITTPTEQTAALLPSAIPADATTDDAIPMSLDADGYHVIGDPAAPIVMTDYSDYF